MSHPREAGVLELLHSLGVPVVERELPAGWWGAWDHHVGAVVLAPGLSAGQRVFTLAHEAAHAIFGHAGHGIIEHEDTARRYAASRVVDEPDYRAGVREGLDAAAISRRQGLPKQAITDFEKYALGTA